MVINKPSLLPERPPQLSTISWMVEKIRAGVQHVLVGGGELVGTTIGGTVFAAGTVIGSTLEGASTGVRRVLGEKESPDTVVKNAKKGKAKGLSI